MLKQQTSCKQRVSHSSEKRCDILIRNSGLSDERERRHEIFSCCFIDFESNSAPNQYYAVNPQLLQWIIYKGEYTLCSQVYKRQDFIILGSKCWLKYVCISTVCRALMQVCHTVLILLYDTLFYTQFDFKSQWLIQMLNTSYCICSYKLWNIRQNST